MQRRLGCNGLLALATTLPQIISAGCHTSAPMMVYKAPAIVNPRTGQPSHFRRVAFAPVDAAAPLQARLERAIATTRPARSEHLAVLRPETPLGQVNSKNLLAANQAAGQEPSIFKLASARQAAPVINPAGIPLVREGTPMDAARARQVDLLIVGHVTVADYNEDAVEHTKPKKIGNANAAGAAMVGASMNRRDNEADEPPVHLVVMWEAIDVPSGAIIDSTVVSSTAVQAAKDFPDLANTADPVERTVLAITRHAWQLYSPTLNEEKTQLVQPWFWAGSKEVRRGNTAAKEGMWSVASQHYQTAVSLHPWNKSAWHNLSMSTVAQEDFELARVQLTKAESWRPGKQTESSEAWIDNRQKEFHHAFDLPTRQGGWREPDPVPRPDNVTEVPPVQATTLDEVPWWTAIPGTKPPGWTWKAWLNQPLP